MLRYTATRLLLIPPKLFVIILVLFGVLNLAGAPSLDSGESATAGGAAAWATFRRQYHLDLPVLVNLRWLTSTETVREWTSAANGVDPVARVAAQDLLDDYGVEAIPGLIAEVRLGADPGVRADASRRLGALVSERKEWIWAADAPGAEVARKTDQWAEWWKANSARLERSPAGKLEQTLLETRLAFYLCNLVHLDLGESSVTRQPVFDAILARLPCSLLLTGSSLTLAYLLALPIGVYSAVRRGSRLDIVLTIVLFALFSLPAFFTATTLLQVFATGVGRWFPNGGLTTPDTASYTALERIIDVAWHLVLPVATYTSGVLAFLSRYARVGVLDVIRSDHVRTARAKGLEEGVVILRHAARNGLLPILTVLGSLLATLVGGSVIIETVFSLPGMGLYLFESIGSRDYNAVMGVLILSSAMTLVGVFLADLAYAVADPRVSFD